MNLYRGQLVGLSAMRRWCRKSDRKGTLIRHAFALAAPVRALAVAMIQASFGTALVAAVGAAVLLEAGLGAAGETAVAMSTITVMTDPEDRLAAETNSLTENHFAMPGHCEPQARLDNGVGSWHLVEAVSDGDLRGCQRGALPPLRLGPHSIPPSTKLHHFQKGLTIDGRSRLR